jgi:fermentation-respiration switch protein FrsA (DUF1100 family)
MTANVDGLNRLSFFLPLLPLLLTACNSYRFFYYPHLENNVSYPVENNVTCQNVYFNSRDGTLLHGWFIPSYTTTPEQAKGTVIHVHGNAGAMNSHWRYVSWLPERGFNVFLFDYRGFGASKGQPSPKGLLEDTQSAIHYIHSRPDIDDRKLVIFAQSLGGNNAIAAVGEAQRQLDRLKLNAYSINYLQPSQEQPAFEQFWADTVDIRALFIDSTFFSYSSIANDTWPGAGLLYSDRYSADHYLSALTVPIAFLHNEGDAVIPYQHSRRLFEKANGPKKLVLIKGGKHIHAMLDYGSIYQNRMVDFFEWAIAQPETSIKVRNNESVKQSLRKK